MSVGNGLEYWPWDGFRKTFTMNKELNKKYIPTLPSLTSLFK